MMPAWYDIFELNIDSKADIEGISKSIEAIGGLIDQIKIKIPTENILLARILAKVGHRVWRRESRTVTNLLAHAGLSALY